MNIIMMLDFKYDSLTDYFSSNSCMHFTMASTLDLGQAL
jgi:hypothetical protein